VRAGRIEVKPYWRLEVTSDETRTSRAGIAEETARLFDAAVKRQLVADVPVGILLSGGLDSSAIAAVAARHATRKVSTFAIVFKERTFDESEFSRQMAAHLQSDHHELVLDEEAILNSLEDVARCFDEPFCEGSALPVYHICRFAKQRVDVLLSGEGSDEIFGGYETYLARHVSRYCRLVPPPLFAVMRWMAHQLPVSDNKVSLDLKLRRWTDGIAHPPAKAHFWWRAALNDRDKARILNPDFLRRLEQPHTSTIYERMAATFPTADVINQLMATDCLVHLPDDLLYRADMMSMAHTLELRVPYLDTELVDYAFSVPSRQKIRGLTNKVPLRDAMKGLIPDRLRLRAKKGLNMPYQKWFKRKTWKSFIHDWLAKSEVEREGVLDFQKVSLLLEEHEKGLNNHAHGLWTILNLVLWLRNRNRD
jgi:asparagine synthase (glutamine-hydrolysing)